MLTHSNAFISKKFKERRRCLDDFDGEYFSVELQISIAAGALQIPEIQLLEDRLYNLIFSYNECGCLDLEKTAYFDVSVKSGNNGLLYETHRFHFDDPPEVLWDERRLWIDRTDEYLISIELEERHGKILSFWHWLEESSDCFWKSVGIKGFLHCDSDPRVAACFRKGEGRRDVFVSTLDIPSENANWFEGTFEEDSINTDLFLMNIDVYDRSLWEQIFPHALQIAAVNQVDLNPNLSLFEKVTDARSSGEAELFLDEHKISFYPGVEVSAGNKYLLEDSIRTLFLLLSEAEDSHFSARTYTGYFYNRKSLYLEIWDINPDTFELVISHTRPLM